MNVMSLFMLEEATTPTSGSMLVTLLPLALLAIVFYFFLYRPQKKQEKEVADMRNSVELGDVIVTTGGIVGMVVKVTEEMLLIETSGNRTKIQIQKWAVQSVLEKANEPDVKEVKSVKSDSGIKMKQKEEKPEKKEKKSLFGKKNSEDK